jgi:hypothetical protein
MGPSSNLSPAASIFSGAPVAADLPTIAGSGGAALLLGALGQLLGGYVQGRKQAKEERVKEEQARPRDTIVPVQLGPATTPQPSAHDLDVAALRAQVSALEGLVGRLQGALDAFGQRVGAIEGEVRDLLADVRDRLVRVEVLISERTHRGGKEKSSGSQSSA